MLVRHMHHCFTSTIGGTLYLPSRMAAPGTYTRSQSMNLPPGAGSQLDSWPARRGVLNVDVDGAVGVRHEAGAIADAVSVDWIRHKAIFRVTHRQRPECVVGRKARPAGNA